MLYVTAEVLRQVAILAQPFMPESAGKLLDLLGVPADRAQLCTSRRAAHRHRCRSATLPAPAPVFPRYVEPTRRAQGAISSTMLIDSHCHLDFPDFADELDAVVAARAPPASAAWSRSRRACAVSDESLAIAERFDDVYCSVGTHPHHAHEETRRDDGRSRRAHATIRRSWRSARPGSTITTTTRRATRRSSGFRTHIAAARETGLPLVIHSRDADDDMARILEEETGKGAFPAVLHCFTGGRRACAARASRSGSTFRSPAS